MKKTHILLCKEWIEIQVNPKTRRTHYDHKLKRIVLKKLTYKNLIHELTHAIHFQKYEFIMSKGIMKDPKIDVFSEYLAVFVQLYINTIYDWAEKLMIILS